MMTVAVVSALLGIVTAIAGGLIIAVLTGKLVPQARVDAAVKETEKWESAYKELKASSSSQEQLLQRIVLTADVSDHVLSKIRSELGGSGGDTP